MPIQWKPIINRLTVPTSYSAQVINNDAVDIDELAHRINLSNPNYPTNIIKDIIQLSYEEIAQYLTEGRPVTLEGFLSFKMSLTKRLVTINDSVNNDNLQVHINPSRPFKLRITQNALMQRIDSVVNIPSISSVKDTGTSYNNYISDKDILNIRGSHLKFDITDNTQGLFITNTANNAITHATHYGLNTAGNILVIPSIPVGDATWNVEYGLSVKARYTKAGTLRIGETAIPSRSLISISDKHDYPQGILTGGTVQTTPFASITAFAYEGEGASLTNWRVRIACTVNGDALAFNLVDNEGIASSAIPLTESGTVQVHRVTASGTDVGVVTIEVADFNKLYKLAKFTYSGVLIETVDLGAVS